MQHILFQLEKVQNIFLDHISLWKDRPEIMVLVARLIAILIATIERISDNGAVKYRIVTEIMKALYAYSETLIDD